MTTPVPTKPHDSGEAVQPRFSLRAGLAAALADIAAAPPWLKAVRAQNAALDAARRGER